VFSCAPSGNSNSSVSEDLDLDLLSLYLKGESRLDLFEAVATGDLSKAPAGI
jgi:hypothetical protein